MTETAFSTELPKSWIWTRIEDIAQTITGNTPSKKDQSYYGDYIPLIKPPQLKDRVINEAEDYLSKKGSEVSRILPNESVLVSCIGILGKTGITNCEIAFNQQINAMIFSEAVIPKYGFYYFQNNNTKKILNNLASATTIPIVNKSKFDKVPIPLPPLSEQYRIVNRIEELFSRLDAGIEELKKAKVQLQRYRQSVLKAAMDGKLTAMWRENHKNEIESTLGPQNKMNVDLSIIESISQNELPKGWYWTTFNQVSERITVGHVGLMKNEYVEDGIPFLRSQNVRENRFDPQGLKYISIKFHCQLKKSKLDPRDLVIVRSGVNAGNACVIPDYIKDANCSDLVIIKRPYAIDPHYGAFYINSIAKLFISNQEVGSAIRHFNTKSVAKMPIIVPPLMEQHIMIDEIERHISITKDSEMAINNILKNVGKMQQSILRKAFEGKLITQDPNDEPAGVLLERIKAKKEQHGIS
jgi:type I restriction enzyme, S subunit